MDILTNSDYNLIFNNFPAGIFLLNSKCNIVRSNYSIESFLGYTKSDLNNLKFYNLINNADEKKIINDALYQEDNFHPNNTGYEIMKRAVLEKIRETKDN